MRKKPIRPCELCGDPGPNRVYPVFAIQRSHVRVCRECERSLSDSAWRMLTDLQRQASYDALLRRLKEEGRLVLAAECSGS